MNKLKFLLSGLILAPIAGANPSYVSLSDTLYDEGSEASIRYTYWQSQTSINSEGVEIPFEEGESYTQMDLEFKMKYGLTDNLQVGAGVLVRSNSSTQLESGEQVSFTTTGVKSGLIQLKYALPKQNRWRLALEADYETNFIANTENNGELPDEIVLGDDGNSTSAGLSGSYFFESMNIISGRVHYRNPSNSLSSEIFSKLEGVLIWSKVSLLVGVENVSSLNQDPYSGDPDQKPAINSGNTLLYNSVNRSWTSPYLGLNFVLNKNWRLETRAQTRTSAVSSDLGTAFTVMLAKRKSESKALKQKYSAFKEYSVEANVIKLTKSKSSVIIDAGLKQGLENGSKIDFYHFDYLGGNEFIASGYIVKVGATKSMVKITKRYSKKRVEDGTLARGGLIRE